MKVDFKLGKGIEFKVSEKDVEEAASHISTKGNQLRGYFVEIRGKEYRMLSLVDQLCKDKGLEISKVNLSPYKIGINFEKLGFRVFRKIPLSSSKDILLLENIHNDYDAELTNSKAIHADRLLINNYELIEFKIINLQGIMKFPSKDVWKISIDLLNRPESVFLSRQFEYFDTYEESELKSGLLLVTSGIEEDQNILFLFYEEDLKKFMDDLFKFITVIDDLLAKFFSEDFKNDKKHFDKSLNNQMVKWKAQDINPMLVMVGSEIINSKYNLDTDEEAFFSFIEGERYNFYCHSLDGIDKKEMKALLEVAKPASNGKWNIHDMFTK